MLLLIIINNYLNDNINPQVYFVILLRNCNLLQFQMWMHCNCAIYRKLLFSNVVQNVKLFHTVIVPHICSNFRLVILMQLISLSNHLTCNHLTCILCSVNKPVLKSHFHLAGGYMSRPCLLLLKRSVFTFTTTMA